MKKSINLSFMWLLGAAIVAAVAVAAWPTSSTTTGVIANNTNASAGVPTASTEEKYKPVKEPKPASDKRKGRDLVNVSAQEVGEYAKLFASQHLKAKGDQEVRLVRNVTREEVTELGLGCIPDFSSIEHPPLILVILKGEFDFSNALPGASSKAPETDHNPGKKSYVAYIFDAWAAFPAAMYESQDGSRLKKALKDPTLPDPVHGSESIVCPTPVPASQKKWHYGEEVPGYTTVPPLPERIQRNAVPTEPAPTAVQGTPEVPLPVPTAENQPLLPMSPPD